MAEMIISFPYKKIVMPHNCTHCGNYNAEHKIEVGQPSPRIVESSKEGSTVLRTVQRIDIPVYLCETCNAVLKNKKKFMRIGSFTALILLLIGIWYNIMPLIYNVSINFKGHIAGLMFFFMGFFSLFIIFMAIGIPAYYTNHFTGLQILAYNPKRIVIRFYNMDLANKFIDLNAITPDQIIKKKD